MSQQEILFTADELKNILATLPVESPFGRLIKANSDNTAKISISKTAEEESEQAEIHDNFNDLFFVLSGEEEFWSGGELADKAETEPGEWLGKNLVGAKPSQLNQGDILIAPKGVPHKHGKGSAVFLIIKTN